MSRFRPLTQNEKGEIEELVMISYQALERNLEERAKKVIKEKSWVEAIGAVNPRTSEMHLDEPWAVPQDPRARSVYPQSERYFGHRPYPGYDIISPEESTAAQASLSRPHSDEYPSARRRAEHVMSPPPIEGGRQKRDKMKTTRSEVRFTLPRAQLVSSATDAVKGAPQESPNPGIPTTKSDDEVRSMRQRLERVKKRKEEAENAKDITTAFDLSNFVIPDMEAELAEVLKQRQRQEHEESVAPLFQKEEDKKPHHTRVETDSE